MLKYAANLTMLWPEVPFAERFERARQAGFKRVEFLFPYRLGLAETRRRLTDTGLEVVLFNLPAGDFAAGERGIACLPDRRQEFRQGVEEAIAYATALHCPRLNCLAGKRPPELAQAEAEAVLAENLAYAADRLAPYGLQLLLEPLNSYDVPGSAVTRTEQAVRILAEVGRGNCRIQYDCYHLQRMQGELVGTYLALAPLIAHVQIADNPGRHQPGTGEIHYPFVLQALEAAGYSGAVGLEYVPLGSTEASLEWLPPALRS